MKETKYTYEEALVASTEYFDGDTLAANVWLNKYALKDSDGHIYELSPTDMHRRLASEIARVEKKYKNPLSEDEIFDLIDKFKYLVPQGGPMSGIGNTKQIVSLSNCFVVGNEFDSYGGIMHTDQEQVQLMKRRGGVGHDLSHLRPSGVKVNNSALSSTGLPSFMERFSNSTREVAQDGRRGALMLSCSVKHPDAEGFIDAKMTEGKVTGANVSVRITDDFMQSLNKDGVYTQQYPIDSDNPEITQETDPDKIWKKIVHNAWKSAEPGILFWDTIIKESLPDCYADLGYKTTSTNPCGEIPLCPYDSCRLLAINLYSYVIDPFTDHSRFDFELFSKHAQYAQRFMDDIIDLEAEKIDAILKKIKTDPEEASVKKIETELWTKIKHKNTEGRRTGLGVTAEGDMLAALGLTYGTTDATEFSVKVHKYLAVHATLSTITLAKERGPFKIWDAKREKDNPFLNRVFDAMEEIFGKKTALHLQSEYDLSGRRNIALLTIAPTGTTSLMTQTTSGVEPVFLPMYKRRKKINPNDKHSKGVFVDEVGDHWEEYPVFHHKLLDWWNINILSLNYPTGTNLEELPFDEIEEIIKKSPYHKATANDVDWKEKVKMQGEIQKWVDHSISVTINLPSTATEELVDKLYTEAWKSGCKGVTVYRDGSRSGVLVSNKEKKLSNRLKENNAPKRPREIDCDVLRFVNKGERWIGFIGIVEDEHGNEKPYEIFTGRLESFNVPPYVITGKIKKIKKNGDEENSRYDFIYKDKDGYKIIMEGLNRAFEREYWNTAKTISAVLRHGMPLPNVLDLIESLNLDGNTIGTWKAGVIRMIKKYIKDGTEASGKTCPECKQETLIYKEGCLTCESCGNSKCG